MGIGREGIGRGKGRGRDPQCLKYVDAHELAMYEDEKCAPVVSKSLTLSEQI